MLVTRRLRTPLATGRLPHSRRALSLFIRTWSRRSSKSPALSSGRWRWTHRPLCTTSGRLTRSVFPQETNELFGEALKYVRQRDWDALSGSCEQLMSKHDEEGLSFFLHCARHLDAPDMQRLLDQRFTAGLAGDRVDEALSIAVERQESNLVQVLLPYCDPNGPNGLGKSPLYIAIEQGSDIVLQMLMEKGADIHRGVECSPADLVAIPEESRDILEGKAFTIPPLAYATMLGRTSAIRLLIHARPKAVETTIVSNLGSVLHVAILFGQTPVLRYLLDEHADKCEYLFGQQTPFSGQTPVSLAARLGNVQALRLLSLRKANLEAPDSRGWRPLDWAIFGNDSRMIGELYRRGASFEDTILDRLAEEPEANSVEKMTRNEVAGWKARIKSERHQAGNFHRRPPLNLCLKGGGPRGLVYPGSIGILEAEGKLQELASVGGTSAGALASALLAVGYRSKELEDIMRDLHLPTLLDLPSDKMRERVLKVATAKGVAARLFEALKGGLTSFKAIKLFYDDVGLAEGVALRNWLDGKIQAKTGIANFTLGELAKRATLQDGYCHFSAFTTQVHPYEKLVCLSSEGEEADLWREVTLASAATVSASIPGLFKPGRLLLKNSVGKPYDDPDTPPRRYVDGGMIANYPVDRWDRLRFVEPHDLKGDPNFPMFNQRTLGLAVAPYVQGWAPDQEVDQMRVRDLVKSIMCLYFHAEDHLRSKFDAHRTIPISCGDIGLFDFDLSSTQKDELVTAGKDATLAYLDRQREDYTFRPWVWDVERATSIPKSRPGVFPYPDNIVESLDAFFLPALDTAEWEESPTSRLKVLYGPAGCGKSEFVAQYARERRQRFSFCRWIDAHSPDSVMKEYRDLAIDLGLEVTKETPDDQVRTQLYDVLAHHRQSRPWLLIYDGVDQHLDYPRVGGCILITSRRRDYWSRSQGLRMPGPDAGLSAQARHHMAEAWFGFAHQLKDTHKRTFRALYLLAMMGEQSLPDAWMREWMASSADEKAIASWIYDLEGYDLIKEAEQPSRFGTIRPELAPLVLTHSGDNKQEVGQAIEFIRSKGPSSGAWSMRATDWKDRAWEEVGRAMAQSEWVPQGARAGFFFQLGHLKQASLHLGEAYSNYRSGVQILRTLPPHEVVAVCSEVGAMWNGLNRMVLYLAQYPSVCEAMSGARHLKTATTYFKTQEPINGIYAAAIDQVLEGPELKKHPHVEVYLQAVSRALTELKSQSHWEWISSGFKGQDKPEDLYRALVEAAEQLHRGPEDTVSDRLIYLAKVLSDVRRHVELVLQERVGKISGLLGDLETFLKRMENEAPSDTVVGHYFKAVGEAANDEAYLKAGHAILERATKQ